MKIGELDQRCGECNIVEFCGNPYGFCICSKEIFKDVEEQRYREIAITADTKQFIGCYECDEDECNGCRYDDKSRDYYCEQVEDEVKRVLNLN